MTESKFRFPLFIDLIGKKVVVIGGGKIAGRRIDTLLRFGANVTVVAPELLGAPEGVQWTARKFEENDLAGATLAVAATDNRAANHAVYEEAIRFGIPVSIADCPEECTFYFPAVCFGENLVAGVVSNGSDHTLTSRAAMEIRQVLEELK